MCLVELKLDLQPDFLTASLLAIFLSAGGRASPDSSAGLRRSFIRADITGYPLGSEHATLVSGNPIPITIGTLLYGNGIDGRASLQKGMSLSGSPIICQWVEERVGFREISRGRQVTGAVTVQIVAGRNDRLACTIIASLAAELWSYWAAPAPNASTPGPPSPYNYASGALKNNALICWQSLSNCVLMTTFCGAAYRMNCLVSFIDSISGAAV